MENKTVEEQKHKLIESLSPLQKKYLEGLDWFLNGGRATGRTHLMCTVVLLSILNGREPAILVDHEVMHEGNRNYVMAMLHRMASDIGLKIKIDKRDNRAIYVTRDKSETMYEYVSEWWKVE